MAGPIFPEVREDKHLPPRRARRSNPRPARDLFGKIISYENLVKAAHGAAKGKRFRENVIAFNLRRSENLCAPRRELIDGTYLPGAYAEFFIPALPSREQIRAEISAEAAAHPELVQEIARQREALMMRMGMRG